VEIVRDEVVVAVIFNCTGQGAEHSCVAESVGLDSLKDFEKIWVKTVRAVVVGMAKVFDVFGQIAEEEDVILSDLASNFNLTLSVEFMTRKNETYVCTVASTNDQTSIQHKLHIRGTTGFSTGS